MANTAIEREKILWASEEEMESNLLTCRMVVLSQETIADWFGYAHEVMRDALDQRYLARGKMVRGKWLSWMRARLGI